MPALLVVVLSSAWAQDAPVDATLPHDLSFWGMVPGADWIATSRALPDLARTHGAQGVAAVTFTMDRGGRVLSVGLVRSSNSALLDDEAVALVHRAEPLPSLPDEVPGSTITLTVPISFAQP